MKTALIIIILFTFALPCLLVICGEKPACAALTANDIRQIIREELKPLEERMAKIETRMTAIETRMTKIEVKMEEKFNSVEDKIALVQTSVDGKLSLIQWFIGGLVALVVAAIAIPQLLILFREKKESKEVDKLREAIAELKGKKLIAP